MQETRRRRRRLLGPVAAAAVLVLALPPASPGAPPAGGGYRENDFGGFRNVLPPGQNGFATGAQISEFLFGGGARPPHNDDQLGMYGDLVYASPGLGAAQLDEFFKDASFGVQASDVDRTYTPACAVTSAPSPSSAACDDVTIVRDKGFAVPHVYGADRAGLMFGLGYVTGEDRLFAADIQRNTGRAQLSSFLGGSQAEMDREQWLQTPYTEADWQRQFDQLDDLYGADGAQVQADVRNYVDGINQYIAEARVNSDKMPGEYGFLGRPEGPAPWTITDVGATVSLVAGIFGKGGGREVDSALVLEEAKKRFGGSKGKRVWNDFRSAEDVEAPVTAAGRKFPYLAVPRKPEGEALPDPGTVKEEDVVVAASGSRGEAGSARFGRIDRLGSATGMSNALLVSAEESADGKPVAVMGPQVGYFTPEVLMEVDAHAPGGPAGPPIDARGATFGGVSLYVQLGRGRDFAWSATSAGQDIIDTFAVELCEPGGSRSTIDSMHYRFQGQCIPFEVLERTNSWTPNLADDTPAGSETLRALRSKLGIVTHRAEVDGKPVAYTSLRATYFHEADSAVGFADFNNPNAIDSPQDFQQAANRIDYTFNWFYADNQHIAYFNSGINPVRAQGTDPNFPIMGEPEFWWQNLDPEALTADRLSFAGHPQAVDDPFLTSWNNKQARGYRAADDNWSWGPVQRVQTLNDRIERLIAGEGKASLTELTDAMEDAATVDLRGDVVLGWILKVIENGKVDDRKLASAIRLLAKWRKQGAHRLDEDRDGKYEHSKAIQIMDAWWPLLVEAQFEPVLGRELFRQIQTMIGLDDNASPDGSSYGSGWYGYVQKDLRAVLGKNVQDDYSREYCGGGNLRRCRNALLGSLAKALKAKAKQLYPDECDEGDRQWCHDAIRHTALGAIGQPRIHWVNRPTFQQVVEAQGHR